MKCKPLYCKIQLIYWITLEFLYVYNSLSLSLSLNIYIYIYIYIVHLAAVYIYIHTHMYVYIVYLAANNYLNIQWRYDVHFRANTLGKGMNPLILPAMG